MTCLRR